MSMTDPIADMLTRIRNANRLGVDVVAMPSSKLKVAVARALEREGFILSHSVSTPEGRKGGGHPRLTVHLKYGNDGERVIRFIDRVSKPGRRVYSNVETIPRVQGGLGCNILSTNRGILSDRECKKENVGGEILCRVG